MLANRELRTGVGHHERPAACGDTPGSNAIIAAASRSPAQMQITCRLEFDSGHRIPHHESQCQHLHGHRYAVEVTLSGDIIATEGSPRQGMVMDFSDVKAIARRELVDVWDHAFLVYRGDAVVLDFLSSMPGHKTVVLPAVPTAENLVVEAFAILSRRIRTSTAIICASSACASSRRPTAGPTRCAPVIPPSKGHYCQ